MWFFGSWMGRELLFVALRTHIVECSVAVEVFAADAHGFELVADHLFLLNVH